MERQLVHWFVVGFDLIEDWMNLVVSYLLTCRMMGCFQEVDPRLFVYEKVDHGLRGQKFSSISM